MNTNKIENIIAQGEEQNLVRFFWFRCNKNSAEKEGIFRLINVNDFFVTLNLAAAQAFVWAPRIHMLLNFPREAGKKLQRRSGPCKIPGLRLYIVKR